MDDETLILWQDVFDEIAAGRKDHLACPKCGHAPLRIDALPSGQTKISCSACRTFLEGSFGLS